MPSRSEAARLQRIQIRMSEETQQALDELAIELGMTRHALASWAVLLGVKAVRQAVDNMAEYAQVKVWTDMAKPESEE